MRERSSLSKFFTFLLQMSLESHQQSVNTTLLEVPITYIPLDTDVCDNSTIPDGHQNHTQHNNTQHQNSSSIADICDIMPQIAQEASKVDGNLSIDCTTPLGRCNMLQCFLTQGAANQRQQELSVRLLPCTMVPRLEVSVGGRAGRTARNFSAPGSLDIVINGAPAPVFFNIRQHSSRLTVGLEVRISLFGGIRGGGFVLIPSCSLSGADQSKLNTQCDCDFLQRDSCEMSNY